MIPLVAPNFFDQLPQALKPLLESGILLDADRRGRCSTPSSTALRAARRHTPAPPQVRLPPSTCRRGGGGARSTDIVLRPALLAHEFPFLLCRRAPYLEGRVTIAAVLDHIEAAGRNRPLGKEDVHIRRPNAHQIGPCSEVEVGLRRMSPPGKPSPVLTVADGIVIR